MTLKVLDEKGFVFLDDNSRPFLVRMLGKRAWLYYWHPNNEWVTLRPVTQVEVFEYSKKKLSEEQARFYF